MSLYIQKATKQKVCHTFCNPQIDILVNNAGRGQRALWLDVDLRVDRELFEINVLGPVSLTQEVLPHMIQRKQGHVVVVSSVAGKLGEYLLCSFCCHVFNIIKHYHFDSSAMSYLQTISDKMHISNSSKNEQDVAG